MDGSWGIRRMLVTTLLDTSAQLTCRIVAVSQRRTVLSRDPEQMSLQQGTEPQHLLTCQLHVWSRGVMVSSFRVEIFLESIPMGTKPRHR